MAGNIENLKKSVGKLLNILNDPHPGLAVWHAAYAIAAKDVTDFMMGDAMPDSWKRAMDAGWVIVPCACSCGGSFGWMKPIRGGTTPAGCVCHTIPVP